jgi:hypothetical protein
MEIDRGLGSTGCCDAQDAQERHSDDTGEPEKRYSLKGRNSRTHRWSPNEEAQNVETSMFSYLLLRSLMKEASQLSTKM